MTGTARNFGLSGAGKGSRPRNMSKKFYDNFNEINFASPTHDGIAVFGFKRNGNKLRKVYR